MLDGYLLANSLLGVKVNVKMTSLSRVALTDAHTSNVSPSVTLMNPGTVTSTPIREEIRGGVREEFIQDIKLFEFALLTIIVQDVNACVTTNHVKWVTGCYSDIK